MMKGTGFRLRHVRKDDLAKLVVLLNERDSRGEFLPLDLLSEGMIERRWEEESRSKEQSETFLIVDDGDTILGRVFHFKTVPYYNSREIGYALFTSAARGKGIMTEAVQLLTDYLFETLLINRLEIHMDVGNVASERVAIKCGYLKEGIARGASFCRGTHIDVSMYALLRQEWEQQA